MTGDDLPGDSHVVHYVKPTEIGEGGKIDGSAFRLRKGESGLSVHWLECFEGLKPQQLDEVRRLSRLNRNRNGRFAELHVNKTKQYVSDQIDGVRFVHKPLNADGNYEADPSHSEIIGLPPRDSSLDALIGDMIAECVEGIYPACNN